MTRTIAVIDGNSLMHRAFHAVPPTMNAPDGTPTNAVFGFFSMFLKFLDESKPDAVVCAFDCGKPAFRVEALAQYKAQRPPMDDNLRVQFPIVENLLSAMNIPIVKVQGWEGDDILGTVAARNEALGGRTLLLTGDKDASQLASELTHIVSMKKGVTDIEIMGPKEVEEKYGVTPEQIPDFLGLMGDSSDNIPGVPGIGKVSAAKLLQQFGSIDGLYQNLDKLKGKQLENVRDNKEAAYVSRQVATISRDADFELDLENIAFPTYTEESVKEAFEAVALRAHLGKVLRLINGSTNAHDIQRARVVVGEVLEGTAAREFVSAALEQCAVETQAQSGTIGVAFELHEAETLFEETMLRIAFAKEATVAILEGEEAKRTLAKLIQSAHFCTVDAKKLIHLVFPSDSAKEALVSENDLMGAKPFDLSLAAYLLDSSIGGTKEFKRAPFEVIAQKYLDTSEEDLNNTENALAFEAASCVVLKEVLRNEIEQNGNTHAFEKIDTPLISVLAIMERTGAAIDAKELGVLSAQTGKTLDELRAQILNAAGEEFNIDSPKQLAHILFEVLGLPANKKTKTGYSTDESVLNELSALHPLPGLILQYRELAKIKSTYIDALPPLRAEDGLVHTSFNETVTTTGRLSSSDPNLQNIPVRSEFGRSIRKCFVPLREGDIFVSADYSQIELRLLAHLSEDANLIAAFNSGADFHAQTAAQIFGISADEVTPEMRSRAKAVNFGIVYGQQAYGLSQSLHIPYKEAQDMIDRYFAAYPGVKSYLEKTITDATQTGYAETMYGRKRHIPELKLGNKVQRGFGERTAMNHPMQGSAADIIKIAMRNMQERLLDGGFASRIMIQVHDELDLSVPREEQTSVCALCKEVMEGVANLRVPLVVEVSYGATWADAH